MKIYYAHCISNYNTQEEKDDVKLLRKLGFSVVNPNTKKNQERYKVIGMEHSKTLLRGCKALAFRPVPSGTISSGVAAEIAMARVKGLPVIELPVNIYRRTMTRRQTIDYIKEERGGWPL